MAFETPHLSSSRNSSASLAPVEAPLGQLATNSPLLCPSEALREGGSVVTTTSTVGFPRESLISRAIISFIFDIVFKKYLLHSPLECDRVTEPVKILFP